MSFQYALEMATKKPKAKPKAKPKGRSQSDKRERSQHLFITSTRKGKQFPDDEFSGTDSEIDTFYSAVTAALGMGEHVKYMIVQRERHRKGMTENSNEGMIHYHSVVVRSGSLITEAMKNSVIECLESHFPFAQHDVRPITKRSKRGGLQTTIGYTLKEMDVFKPKFYGDYNRKKIMQWAQSYIDQKKIQKSTKSKAQAELSRLVRVVSDYMRQKGVHIIQSTRKLNIDHQQFFTDLEADCNLFERFGFHALKTVEQLISDYKFHVLPMMNPNPSIVKYSDCYWDMDSEEEISLEDGERMKLQPVFQFEEPISHEYDEFPPPKYGALLRSQLMTDDLIARFREAFGLQFRTKRLYDKALWLWGPSRSGKTMMVYPFRLLYNDVLCSIPNDGRFSFQSASQAERVFVGEMSVDILKASADIWKLMLEGDDKTPAPVKGKESVYLKQKTVVATANEGLSEDNNFQDEAMRERWHVVRTNHAFADKFRKIEWTRYIKKELPKIIKWLTTSSVITNFNNEDDSETEKTLEEFMWTDEDKERFRKATRDVQQDRLRRRQLRIEMSSD